MRKKWTAFALALAMMTAALPKVNALSASGSQVEQQIRKDYESCLAATEKESLWGFCGLTASWQLYFMGINQYPIMADGNKQYDAYRDMEVTTGGYYPKAYGAEDYTLEQALNTVSKHGTRDVYNMVACFEKTDTEAGAQYGHAVVIYAILDGMVYFTETFQTSFGSQEGQPVKLSIHQFAQYYRDWTTYEGLIYFGEKNYANQCALFPADLFIEITEETALQAEPRTVTEEEEKLPVAASGEILHVTGVYRNPEDQYYYEVEEQGRVAYVQAENGTLLAFNDEAVRYIPNDGEMKGGLLVADYGRMESLEMDLSGSYGRREDVCIFREPGQAYELSADKLQEIISKAAGENGQFQGVSVVMQNYYVKNGNLRCKDQTIEIVPQEAQMAEKNADGWVRANHCWYYYWGGSPVTGWLNYRGSHYYMNQDGAAVTGKQTIDGEVYQFSSNGVLQTT